MAQRQITVRTDDLTNDELKPGEGETVVFALDGVTYEIDLTEANAELLRQALAPYVGNARRQRVVRMGTTSAVRRAPRLDNGDRSAHKEELARIREWARANGYQVSDRGRISTELRQAYESAN